MPRALWNTFELRTMVATFTCHLTGEMFRNLSVGFVRKTQSNGVRFFESSKRACDSGAGILTEPIAAECIWQ